MGSGQGYTMEGTTDHNMGSGQHNELSEWNKIFAQLDQKDGVKDGRISTDALIDWLDTLDFQKTVMFEADHGIPREKVRWLVELADQDQDRCIDRQEFLTLVTNY